MVRYRIGCAGTALPAACEVLPDAPPPPPPAIASLANEGVAAEPVSSTEILQWYSGNGASWVVTQHSPLVSYCATYDLCDLAYAFDGTASNPVGRSIDFAGPNRQPAPWTLTIDMGTRRTWGHWRVAGHPWYSFGDARLKYEDASGEMMVVPGSQVTWSTAPLGPSAPSFVVGHFTAPVTAQRFQIELLSATNTDHQARYQLYLTEVQFGITMNVPPPPWKAPEAPPPSTSMTTASADVGVCTNSCASASDGDCDDGGPGSEFSLCDLGDDCDDCGTRGGGDPSSNSASAEPCFPSSALVTRADGSRARIADLRAGDKILATTANGDITHDTVSLFSLADDAAEAVFLTLTTEANQTLHLTPEHHLPIGPTCCTELKMAKHVAVGELIFAMGSDGALRKARVVHTSMVIARGLHSPLLTAGGFPIVDDIVTAFNQIEMVRLDSVLVPLALALCTPTASCSLLRRAVVTAECAYKSLLGNGVCKTFHYIDGLTVSGTGWLSTMLASEAMGAVARLAKHNGVVVK